MSDGLHDAKPTYYMSMSMIKPGRLYRHFKGDLYVVLSVAWDSGDVDNLDTRVVTYMNLETGRVYHRDLLEFASPKEHEDGKKEPRFIPCGECRVTINTQGKYEVARIY